MSFPTISQRIAVAALVVLAIALRLVNLNNVNERTPDERIFTQFANMWLEQGHAGMLATVADYERNPANQLYPPPTRFGMIRLVAAAMQWTGRRDAGAGAIVSCAASIFSILIFTQLGLRFFPRDALLFALLFNAVSPMQLMMSRRTWTDSLVEMLGLLMVYIECEVSAGSRRRTWFILFAAAAGAGIAIKEYMVLPCGLCALWILWVLLFERRDWIAALTMVGATAVGVLASVCWLAAAVGGFADLIRVVSSIPSANALNAYALEYASGPGVLLLSGFFIISPAAAIFCIVGLYFALLPPSALAGKAVLFRGVAAFLISLMLFAMVLPHWLNLRYVAPAFGPFYLLAGLGFAQVFAWHRTRSGALDGRLFAAAAFVLVTLDAGIDYMRFQRIFVQDGTPDLSIKYLLDERRR